LTIKLTQHDSILIGSSSRKTPGRRVLHPSIRSFTECFVLVWRQKLAQNAHAGGVKRQVRLSTKRYSRAKLAVYHAIRTLKSA